LSSILERRLAMQYLNWRTELWAMAKAAFFALVWLV
jgi:hypothetical protein